MRRQCQRMLLKDRHRLRDHRSSVSPFVFPKSQSTVLPDPSIFFAPSLLSYPLPTNSFFQNFTLNCGDQPEYIHPYLVKSSHSSLSLCYPSHVHNSSFIYQVFVADIAIYSSSGSDSSHVISSFSDLGVTLDFPASNMRFFLVRGSPFLSCSVSNNSQVSVSTVHDIVSFSSNDSFTKFTIELNNSQTWVLYASSPIHFIRNISSITSDGGFSGMIRIAVLPEGSYSKSQTLLDQFSYCYPVSGDVEFTGPFRLEYKWITKGWGDLLMLAHPLHAKLLSMENNGITILPDVKYKSIDGELVGVVGNLWVLKSRPISLAWHSIDGVNEKFNAEIVCALLKDVEELNFTPITTSSSYYYGKLIARAARLALIAEEVCLFDVIPVIKKFLKDAIEPWLDGSFNGNGFLYDDKWGGIITQQGSTDAGADFGFGVFNDHHYHLGYFLYAIAVLAKTDPSWGKKYRPQAYSLMADFMNLGKKSCSIYPRLRCFDLYKLHSWAGGLVEFADGRNQESTSEAVGAYYSAALMGLAYGDTHLVSVGSVLAALEIQAAQTWCHVREGDATYEADFTSENRVVGVLWSSKRDSGLWFAPASWKECRLGIQVLPLLPITRVLFSDVAFVRGLVNWALPSLEREDVGEGWKGFVYALEGMYNKEEALTKIATLNGYDDGNSLTNLLWWIYSSSSDEEDDACCQGRRGILCWFSHYCD